MPRKKAEASPQGKRSANKDHGIIGQRLRAARLKEGVSQHELGKALSISFQQVQKYEKGVNRMDISRMLKACEILHVDMDYFLDDIEAKKKANGAHLAFDAIMATREGVQVIQAMIELSPGQRQFLVDIARKLPHIAST